MTCTSEIAYWIYHCRKRTHKQALQTVQEEHEKKEETPDSQERLKFEQMRGDLNEEINRGCY